MRNPYVVGRWVSGQNHYGRQRVIDTLLNSPETEFWVVGTRRAGKTSLLHQLEHLTDREGCSWVPLIWDMQGCETSGDLSDELYLAVEDAHQRFEHCGVTVRSLAGLDASAILVRLAESIGIAGKKLLLMADEVEVLLRIARSEPAWVTRLHGALSSGNQKTILTSTQLLANLNLLCVGNAQPPFLQNFNVIHLWKLEPEVAAALVEQRQSDESLSVAPEIVAAILNHTNCNPYLIQYLCHRLYCEAGAASSLRAPEPADIDPDHLLAGLFSVDLQHMSTLQRQIMLLLAERTGIEDYRIESLLAGVSATQLQTILWGLECTGQIRLEDGCWKIGNIFQRQWLTRSWYQLTDWSDSQLKDDAIEQIYLASYRHATSSLPAEVELLEAKHAVLHILHRQLGLGTDPEFQNELAQTHRRLAVAHRVLNHHCDGRAAAPV